MEQDKVTFWHKLKGLLIKPRKVHNISSRQARLESVIKSEVISLPVGEMEKRLYG